MEANTLIEEKGIVMACATSVHIAALPAQAAAAHAATRACLEWFQAVEACLTRFAPDSELSQLNRAAGTWFTASETLFAVTQAALAAAAATDGLFDPTLLAQMTAAGYDRDYDLIAQQEVATTSDVPQPTGGWRKIALDPPRHSIRLPIGVGLDFGGIAKGWAVDRALSQFCDPFPGAILSIGGDIALRGGPQADAPWPVGIYDPHRSVEGEPAQNIAVITLGQGGIATSGATRRWWRQQGEQRHHLIDPRTGQPADIWLAPRTDGRDAELIAMVTALAPTAMQAEVAAKVALLRGPDSKPTENEGAVMWVMGDGQVRQSANFETYLANHGGGKLWRMH